MNIKNQIADMITGIAQSFIDTGLQPAMYDCEVQGREMPNNHVMKKLTKAVVINHNLAFVHVRQVIVVGYDEEGAEILEYDQFGGLTVAYSKSNADGNSNMVLVSLSWCNPNERFKKLSGRYFAAMRYNSGQFTPIRLSSKTDIAQQIEAFFRRAAEY